MHPILFTIPGIDLDIRAYGMAMALGFIINIYFLSRRSLRERIDPDLGLNMCLAIIIGTFVGGRLLFVITQWSSYFPPEAFQGWTDYLSLSVWREHGAKTLRVLKVWEGGLVFYGGFIGSFAAAILYVQAIARKRGMPIYDLAAPYAGLGLAIHRTFGCFLNGCCYGAPTTAQLNTPWGALRLGVQFPYTHQSIRIYGQGVRVHPTQLYEALNGLAMFLILVLWRRYVRRAYGELVGLMFMIYAVNRFVIEFFRGDPVRGFVGYTVAGWELTTSQLVGLLVFPLGLAIFIFARLWGLRVGEENPEEKGSPFYVENGEA